MTYNGKVTSLIDDVVRASQSAAGDQGARTNPGGAPPSGMRGTDIDPRCAALLSRILSDSPQTGTPCIQFVACDPACDAAPVSFGTAHAAASLLGRTLLLNARLEPDAGAHLQTGAPVPDAFMARLYHRHLTPCPMDTALLFGLARQEVLNALAAPFRLVVIETRAPSGSPAATALAPLCTATILVVAAGVSRLAQVQETSRHIAAAGGRIIGSILAGAPADLPGWAGGA